MLGDFVPPRVLFCSYHSYLDSASGAAASTRDLLELLAARGWCCGVVCGPRIDNPAGASAATQMRQLGSAISTEQGQNGNLRYRLHHSVLAGVPITLFQPTPDVTPYAADDPPAQQGQAFVEVVERVRGFFKPDLLLAYGGHTLMRQILSWARSTGLRTVFAIHNFAYTDADFLRLADALFVPSMAAQSHYQAKLGLTATVLPGPFAENRLICTKRDPRFFTFVNPQPEKGVYVVARLVHEMSRRRPDLPFLIVEGRGGIEMLDRAGFGLLDDANLHLMANTNDPRDFLRWSAALLMPSLAPETLGRLAVEASFNGVPVLGTSAGALAETVGPSGHVVDLPPDAVASALRQVPPASAVEPWLRLLEMLWDDAEFYRVSSERALNASAAWQSSVLLPRFERFLIEVAERSATL